MLILIFTALYAIADKNCEKIYGAFDEDGFFETVTYPPRQGMFEIELSKNCRFDKNKLELVGDRWKPTKKSTEEDLVDLKAKIKAIEEAKTVK